MKGQLVERKMIPTKLLSGIPFVFSMAASCRAQMFTYERSLDV